LRCAIYARVSTFDQEPENQLAELRRYAVILERLAPLLESGITLRLPAPAQWATGDSDEDSTTATILSLPRVTIY